jgi:hypothetical protein
MEDRGWRIDLRFGVLCANVFSLAREILSRKERKGTQSTQSAILDLQFSILFLWGDNGKFLTGSALRLAHANQESRLRCGSGAHTCSWVGRQHGDLLFNRSDTFEDASSPEAR